MTKNNDFYLEEPTINRKQEAKEYVKEFKKYNEKYNGIGKLKEIDNKLTYEEYLKYLDNMKDEKYTKKQNDVPQTTYFLIRKSDNKIIGITNLKHYLNKELLECGGHIGYGIRPSERNKGYGKIALSLTLKEAKKINLKEVRVDCLDSNKASIKIIEANKGKKYKSTIKNGKIINLYNFEI